MHQFRTHVRRVPALLLAWGGLIVLVPGCGGSSRAYTPTTTSAREALDSALASWQKGAPPSGSAASGAQFHFVDSQWQNKQVLEGYEIVEEQPGESETEKRFAVLLKMKKPKGEKHVQYVLIGRDPLWIFRDDDYKKASEMGDDPRPKRLNRRR